MVRLTKAHCGALFQVFQTGSLCDNCLEDRAEKAREESRGRAKPSGIIGNGGPLHERQPGIAGGPANAFRSGLIVRMPSCVSGTWHNDGESRIA